MGLASSWCYDYAHWLHIEENVGLTANVVNTFQAEFIRYRQPNILSY